MAINLTPGTASHKAYHQGVAAFDTGKGEGSCPYITNRVHMLRSWWMVGYHELDLPVRAKKMAAQKNAQ